MNKYAFSIIALNRGLNRADHNVIILEADDMIDAKGKAYLAVHTYFPAEDGWDKHSIVGLCLTEEEQSNEGD